MEIDELTFDIDNVDVEEQMLAQDIEEEANEEEARLDNIEDEESDKKYKKLCSALTLRNLEIDLTKPENLRNVYTFKKDNISFKGYVLHKMDNDTFIFNIEDDTKDSGYRCKKFKLSEIRLLQ